MNNKITPDQLLAADKRVQGDYTVPLSKEERITLSETIAATVDEIDQKEADLKEHAKLMREEIKALKEQKRELMKQRRTGFVERNGTLLLFYRPDERMKYCYDESGSLVKAERMTASEFEEARQLSILNQDGIIRMPAASNE